MAAVKETGDEGKTDIANNDKQAGIGSAACGTRIKSFYCTGGWCVKAITACNEWLEQCKDNIKIQDISSVIRNSSNADTLYYFIHVIYTIDKQGGRGWNVDGYKSRIKLFSCKGGWGQQAEKECNGWLEKANKNLKVQKMWNVIRNSSNKDSLYYFYFVAYTVS